MTANDYVFLNSAIVGRLAKAGAGDDVSLTQNRMERGSKDVAILSTIPHNLDESGKRAIAVFRAEIDEAGNKVPIGYRVRKADGTMDVNNPANFEELDPEEYDLEKMPRDQRTTWTQKEYLTKNDMVGAVEKELLHYLTNVLGASILNMPTTKTKERDGVEGQKGIKGTILKKEHVERAIRDLNISVNHIFNGVDYYRGSKTRKVPGQIVYAGAIGLTIFKKMTELCVDNAIDMYDHTFVNKTFSKRNKDIIVSSEAMTILKELTEKRISYLFKMARGNAGIYTGKSKKGGKTLKTHRINHKHFLLAQSLHPMSFNKVVV
jgi:hypothetical protein